MDSVLRSWTCRLSGYLVGPQAYRGCTTTSSSTKMAPSSLSSIGTAARRVEPSTCLTGTLSVDDGQWDRCHVGGMAAGGRENTWRLRGAWLEAASPEPLRLEREDGSKPPSAAA